MRLWGVLAWMWIAPVGLVYAQSEEPAPQRALGINDAGNNVVLNGVRVRLTKTAFDYLKVTVRDTLKTFGLKGGRGMNLMVDPGYDPSTHTAGPVRTTPVEANWAWGGGANQWIQNRKWGPPGVGDYCNSTSSINGNDRGFPTVDLQNLNREQGFYVNDTECFKAFNFCTTYSQGNHGGYPGADIYTPHVGMVPGPVCSMAPVRIMDGNGETSIMLWLHLNIGFYIFPTMFVENEPSPIGGWGPADKWPYVSTVNTAVRPCVGAWCAGAFPTGIAPTGGANPYNPTAAYSAAQGSYFRSGDDTAMYLNNNMLQVQSKDYDATSKGPANCGTDLVYNGQRDADNEPVYFTAPVAQCMRPKSYWKDGANVNPLIKLAVGEVAHWQQCDPYDTYRLDLTLNPKRDDNEFIYAPTIGAAGTCGAATGPFTANNSGWFGMEITSFKIYSDATAEPLKNAIALDLNVPEVRIEFGLWMDAEAIACEVWVCPHIRFVRAWNTGMASSTYIRAHPTIKLNSIDDASCVPGGAAAACSGFWHSYNDNLVLPDKLLIEIIMDPVTGLELAPLAFNGSTSCLINIIGFCALTLQTVLNMVSGMITDVVKNQLGPVVLGLLADLTGIVPNLSSLLGDPWNLGTALVDYGLFFTGDQGQSLPASNPPKWPLRFFDGPGGVAGTDKVGDLRMALGFKPIAFRPANPAKNNIMTIDPNDPPCGTADLRAGCTALPYLPAVASTYGVPTLMDPDTSTCQLATGTGYTHRMKATGTYTYNNSTGKITSISFTTGNFADLRIGDTFFDVDKAKSLPIITKTTVIGIGPGRGGDFNGGNFQVTNGVVETMAGLSVAMTAIAPNMTFVDSNADTRRVRIAEVAGTRLFVDKFDAVQFNGGAFRILFCTGPGGFPTPDTDGVYDADATVVAVAAGFVDAKTGITTLPSRVIKEYFVGPIKPYKKPPAWCASPNIVRTGATGTNFGTLYPQTTWLTFNQASEKPPLPYPAAAPVANTFGNWDTMKPGTVLAQNQNNVAYDATAIPYDLSIHVHQRTFASIMQSLVASGVTCLDFSTKDTEGTTTPWASFLNVNAFAAVMPELAILFPQGTTMSVHLQPVVTPHVRTGLGSLSFSPKERVKDPVGGPLPIVAQPYTLGVALPDLKIDIVVHAKPVDITVLTVYWSTTFGFYAKAVRMCYKLDPLWMVNGGTAADELSCTSTQVNERRVSGYYELFADLNSVSLGNSFENVKDGFPVGQFSNRDIGTVRGQSAFVITQSVCNSMPTKCKKLGLSQAVPMLLGSLVQMFLVTRFSFMNFTVDFLYAGPDGPNDDGVGGGDYLGIYGRFLGDLDVFGLIGSISGGSGGLGLAPGMSVGTHDMMPMASIPSMPDSGSYFRTNTPTFDIALRGAPGKKNAVNSYSYQIDDGFWHTPVDDAKLDIQTLLEGEHKLAIKAYSDTAEGAFAQVTPTVLSFTVDTLEPVVTIHPSQTGFFRKRVKFSAADLQTPEDRLTYRYSFDGGDWEDTEENTVALRGLVQGRHTLRVQATDLAGNVGSSARLIVVDSMGWSCSSNAGADDSVWLIALTLLGLIWTRRRRSV